jgi:asparagine synthase (glutamine-hydrolysing)
MKGQHRGPEHSTLQPYLKLQLGFHRLAINGLNEAANQPLIYNDVLLICNGEIYNYKELYQEMGVQPTTGSDCEVIIHLYLRYGIEQTLTMLDGVYAFVLYDNRLLVNVENRAYVARDPFGVRPLYSLEKKRAGTNTSMLGFASELKCLEFFYNEYKSHETYNVKKIGQFEPGTYSTLVLPNQSITQWKIERENVRYFVPGFTHNLSPNFSPQYLKEVMANVAMYLLRSVEKRCLTTERPIACLLSGGLDSSLITALVNDFYKKQFNKKLETYSIGLQGSEDLAYARKVADYLGTSHCEILVTEEEMFEVIPEVIQNIESYDTTTVRASIGNYLLGKYISTHSDAKVIFNGDGSDELFGGYLYMHHCPDNIEFDREIRRLLKDIHLFDVLRSDKCISSHGLEPRTPFLDKNFVQYVLSLPLSIRNFKNNTEYPIEKYLLRACFDAENIRNKDDRPFLPEEILWRKKEAFSDGVSSHGRSLYVILQEKIAAKMTEDAAAEEPFLPYKEKYYPCLNTEKKYYKQIFDEAFPDCEHLLPYFWMPKYTNATDPSARTLAIYIGEPNGSPYDPLLSIS